MWYSIRVRIITPIKQEGSIGKTGIREQEIMCVRKQHAWFFSQLSACTLQQGGALANTANRNLKLVHKMITTIIRVQITTKVWQLLYCSKHLLDYVIQRNFSHLIKQLNHNHFIKTLLYCEYHSNSKTFQ